MGTQGVFDIGKGGENAVIQLFTAKDMSCNRMSVVIVTSSNTFKLKPDLFIITKTKTSMGGAFSDTKLEFQTEDAGLSAADLQFVSTYFLGIALEQLKASQGTLLQTQANQNCGPYRPLPKQCNPWQKNPRKPDFCRAHLEEAAPMPMPMPRPMPMPTPQPFPQDDGYGSQYPQDEGYGSQYPQDDGYGSQYPQDEGYGGVYQPEDEDMQPTYPQDDYSYGGGSNEGYPMEGVEDDDSQPKRKNDGKKKGKKKHKKKHKNGRRGGKGKGVRRKPKRDNRRNRRPYRGNRRPVRRKPKRDNRRNRRPSRGNRRPSRGNRRTPVRRKKSRGGRGKGRRNRRGRGSRKLRGHGNKLFPTTDSSHLSRKCSKKVCPMIGCQGKLIYMDAKDCCGTCSSPFQLQL